MGNLFSSEADRENRRRAAEIQQQQAIKAQQQRDREAAEYQQRLPERAALKAALELRRRRLEEALKRKREREQEEYRQRWPSLQDQSLSSPSYTQSFTQSHKHRGAFLDSWKDWEDWKNNEGPHYHSQTSPTAVSNAHEDVDLGEWRKRRAANRNQMEGRRVRGRKPKGDLFEDDYHAGHTKDEIKSMCREQQAGFELSA